MALQISRAGLASWKQRYERLHARLKGVSHHTEKLVNTAVHTVEVTGGAFAMGVLTGRNGGTPVEIMGVPLDLGAGLAGHLLAFTGLAGEAGKHLHAFSDGFLASYAATQGVAIGAKWAGAPAAVHGELTGGRGLSDRQVARYAQAPK